MAPTPEQKPDAFLSYTRADDEYSGGQITAFCSHLERPVKAVTGKPFVIFQDIDGIGLGEHWPNKLDKMLDQARFFMPMVTPSFFESKPCRAELERFLDAERKAGREDLILPIYCIDCDVLEQEMLRSEDPLATVIHERQRHDWRDLLFEPFVARNVRLSLQALARKLQAAGRRRHAVNLVAGERGTNCSPDATALTPHSLPPGTVFRDVDEPWCPEMVKLPPGRFKMGSTEDEPEREPHEGPIHAVDIDRSIALGRYPVTRSEFTAFASETGHRSEGIHVLRNDLWTLDHALEWRDPGFQQTEQDPVVGISRDDALAYLAWLGEKTGQRYELPSEAVWEYACRAGTSTPFCTGRTISTDQANHDGKIAYGGVRTGIWRRTTTPVGAFAANSFGLHDMHGNVWEWCADRWHGSYEGAPADGRAWLAGRSAHGVVRGGSWLNGPALVRSASRLSIIRNFRYDNTGFRCARLMD